jgi:hypothetical protein
VVDAFTLTSVHGGTRVEFRGEILRGLQGYEGTSYVVALLGDRMSANLDVYDVQPHQWTAFFTDLADHWKGWTGEKTHESLEGHLRVSCTMDRIGHVELRVQLRGDTAGAGWRAEDTVYLAAGQLDAIARAAATYFG